MKKSRFLEEVTANDLLDSNIIKNFKVDDIGTIHNENWTYFADVKAIKKLGRQYTFRSVTYGDLIIVDFKTNSVVRI